MAARSKRREWHSFHRFLRACRHLLFDRQFEDDGAAQPVVAGAFARCAVWLVIGLTALNVVSTLVECGSRACADNPVVYELLQHGS
jgi:hypothetical protein